MPLLPGYLEQMQAINNDQDWTPVKYRNVLPHNSTQEQFPH